MRAYGLCALAVILAWAPAAIATPDAGSTATATAAVNGFGLDLLRLPDRTTGNTVVSPYSIQVALAMAYAGSAGTTRTEMAAALHFPKDGAPLDDSFAALAAELAAVPSPVQLIVADRLFGQTGSAFRPAYLQLLQSSYGAALESLDFDKNWIPAAARINTWVANQTQNRIRDLVAPDSLHSARLVLANALYLKAPWSKRFDPHNTAPQPFHLADGSAASVPMMAELCHAGYELRDGYSVIALPYVGGLEFVIFLPDAPDGLPAVEKKLTPAILASAAASSGAEINLFLPKTRLEPDAMRLGGDLQQLGMRSAFDLPSGSADFDGIAPRTPDDHLFISEVVHKTFLSVDEDGTEAAAATAVLMFGATAMPAPPVTVRVDHPFFFAIRHRASGVCLFLGRIADPR